jgi:DNA modification methylase
MLGWEDTVTEYIDHLVQIFREIRRVLKPGGVFWLNIGDKVEEKDWMGIPELLLHALKADGWRCAAKIVWHVPNRMPDSVQDRPTCDYEMVYMLTKQSDYYFEAIREPAKCADDPRRGKRVRYSGKYDGTTGFGQQSFAAISVDGLRKLRSVWSIPSDKLSKYSHCFPFSKELVRRMLLLGCPPGGVVMDCFAGSGTTGLVALALERRAVLIEANTQFAAEAKERIDHEVSEYRTKTKQEGASGNPNDETTEEMLDAAE